jgi:hypothetical protein
LRSNGSYSVKVKTINGSFDFDLARFKSDRGSTNYFSLAGLFTKQESYESTRLTEYVSYWATKVSYETVSELSLERCGGVLMSDQHIQQVVLRKVQKIELEQEECINKNDSLSNPSFGIGDIYNADSQEVIWFEDGVSVSQQKGKRDKKVKQGRERTTTDMVLLQRPTTGFECIVAAGKVSLTNLSQSKLKQYYGGQDINIVVLSDGSRTIKNRCQVLFESNYIHILDWYHLQKKVKELMTMIAPNKEAKIEYIRELNHLFWIGKVGEALEKLKRYAVRNQVKHLELIGYIEKNKDYIINYERRKEAKKTIGSGRMEKKGDIIIAKRQKEKAMSWSPIGSNAIAVLTAKYDNLATENLH